MVRLNDVAATRALNKLEVAEQEVARLREREADLTKAYQDEIDRSVAAEQEVSELEAFLVRLRDANQRPAQYIEAFFAGRED